MVDELKLLRTSGLQNKIDAMAWEDLCTKMGRRFAMLPPSNSPDGKRNHDLLHDLKNSRNSVHPVLVVSTAASDSEQDFVGAIWIGLRILVLLNEIFGIESPLANP